MPYCEYCHTQQERSTNGIWVCECLFCAECGHRTNEDFLDANNLCERCRKKAYEKLHGCHSCGDLYDGGLIYVGNNAAGIPSLYCPPCAADDIAHELSMMKQAIDANDKEAHRLAALEVLGRLIEELEGNPPRGGE